MSQTLKIWRITALLFFGLLVFLYTIANTVAGVYNFSKPVLGFVFKFDNQNQLYIDDVIEGGPAQQAGLQKGDMIVALNGIPLESEDGVWQLFTTMDVEQPVEVTARRGDRELTFSVPSRTRLSVYTSESLLSLVPGILFCYTILLVGIFVLLQRLEDRRAHVFYLMLMFWALTMWHSFDMGSSAFLHFLPDWFVYVQRTFFPIAAGLLLYFSVLFPKEKPVFQRHRAVGYLVMFGPVLLIPVLITAHLNYLNWVDNILQIIWTIWIGSLFALAMSSMAVSTATADDPLEKNQSRFIYYATMLTLAMPTGLRYLPMNVFGYEIPGSRYLLLATVLWPFLLGYAIIKHRMMDTSFIIKRGVVYASISGIVIALYFLFVVVIGQFVLKVTGATSQIVTILATLFIASIFNPLKNRIHEFIDRKFFPSKFSSQEAIREFRHELINVVDLHKLLDLLLKFLSEQLQVQSIAILWNSGTNGEYKVRTSKGLGSISHSGFSTSDVVVKRLKNRKRLVDLSPLWQKAELLSEDEKKRWRAMQTELAMPLLNKGELNGLISLSVRQEGGPYYKEDIDLLDALGDQINISLQNALLTEELREQDRLKQELEVARHIQLSSLPQSDPKVDGLDISGSSTPALEVGGDYYDYFRFPDGRFAVIVGDVSGKGTSAALYMAQLKGILRTASLHHKTLHGFFSEINTITFGNIEQKSFITLTCGTFDTRKRRLKLVRAGHLPMLYYSAGKQRCRQIEPRGIGIGLESGAVFERELQETEIRFDEGDVFVFFSDGICEAHRRDGEEFGMEQIQSILMSNCDQAASCIRENIISQVHAFSGTGHLHDDMTIVVAKIQSADA